LESGIKTTARIERAVRERFGASSCSDLYWMVLSQQQPFVPIFITLFRTLLRRNTAGELQLYLDNVHFFLLIGTAPTFSMRRPVRDGHRVLLGFSLV